MNCLIVQLFVCCVLSRLEHNILINVKCNPNELQNSWNVYTLSMNNGGSLAGKLVLLLMIQDVVSFILCAGIPSVWPDFIIIIFGVWLAPITFFPFVDYSFGPFEAYSN